MNELSSIFAGVKSGDTVILEKNKVYAIAPEDSFHKKGLFFSNTAKKDENPEGERFCGIYLEDKTDVTIDGNGASVLIHGIMTPFIFKNCKNIIIKNLSFDHFRPSMSELTVTESEKGVIKAKINDEIQYRIDNNVLYWHSEKNTDGEYYWEIPYKGKGILTNAYNPETGIIGDMLAGEGDEYHGFPDITDIKEISRGELIITFRDKNKFIPVGTVSQTRCIKRFQTGGAIDGCENVRLENLRIMSMNCFGILGQNSKNLVYEGLDCTPADGRTVVSDADFFHFSGCSGYVKVLNCKARGAHDDIINIHGTHLKIINADRENNTLVLRYSHPESWGFNAYNPGEEIEYVCGNTLLPYGGARVLSAEKISPTDVKISVDRIPDVSFNENDVIENISRTASLTVDGCVFERIPSRAILCTTRKDVRIVNSTFRCMGAPAVVVADDANFWFESGRSGNIYFENNTVIDCGAREHSKGCDVIRYEPVVIDKSSEKPVHGTITVRNNKFINTLYDRYTVNLNFVGHATVENNESNVKIEIKDNCSCLK